MQNIRSLLKAGQPHYTRTNLPKGCHLSYLPGSLLAGMVQLSSLDLAVNSFTTVDPAVRRAASLASLNLDQNRSPATFSVQLSIRMQIGQSGSE